MLMCRYAYCLWTCFPAIGLWFKKKSISASTANRILRILILCTFDSVRPSQLEPVARRVKRPDVVRQQTSVPLLPQAYFGLVTRKTLFDRQVSHSGSVFCNKSNKPKIRATHILIKKSICFVSSNRRYHMQHTRYYIAVARENLLWLGPWKNDQIWNAVLLCNIFILILVTSYYVA